MIWNKQCWMSACCYACCTEEVPIKVHHGTMAQYQLTEEVTSDHGTHMINNSCPPPYPAIALEARVRCLCKEGCAKLGARKDHGPHRVQIDKISNQTKSIVHIPRDIWQSCQRVHVPTFTWCLRRWWLSSQLGAISVGNAMLRAIFRNAHATQR
jgi:hypothetical protein